MADRYETTVLSGDELEEWDLLVRRTPQGTLFSSTRWFRTLGEMLEKDWRVLGCFKNANLIGGAISLSIRKYGLDLFLPPLLTGYPGIHYLPPEGSRACERVEEVLRRVEAIEKGVREMHAMAWLVHAPAMAELRPFVWNKWECVPRYTFVLKLVDREAMKGNLKHSLRKQIRKAEEKGLAVRAAGDVGRVVELYERSYGRRGTPAPVEPGLLARWYGRLAQEGTARAYVVEDDAGAAHAFRIVLVDGPTAFDWIAGSDPDHLSEGGTPYLLWKVIETLAGDCETFDFMGANIRSIASFKTGFGGDLVPYWETRRFRSPWVRSLFSLKEAMKSRGR